MTTTEHHSLAYILNHRYFGSKLIDDQLVPTSNFINVYRQETMCETIKFYTSAFMYKDYLFFRKYR